MTNEARLNLPEQRTEKANRRSITIEDSFWEFADKLGSGNASQGIRIALLKCWREQSAEDNPGPRDSQTNP